MLYQTKVYKIGIFQHSFDSDTNHRKAISDKGDNVRKIFHNGASFISNADGGQYAESKKLSKDTPLVRRFR